MEKDKGIATFDEKHNASLIYFVSNDLLFVQKITAQFLHTKYSIFHFFYLNDLKAAFEIAVPSIIILDMVFDNKNEVATNFIHQLKEYYTLFPPVIIVSSNSDLSSRLSAVKVGADRYYAKPIDFIKLKQTLGALTAPKSDEAFRVLILDESESSLIFYRTLLEKVGVKVQTLSEPLDIITVMVKFKPELLVLNVFMEGCSGLDLAQVIRQDDTWAMMPIIFLTADSVRAIKTESIIAIGDEFIIKPIKPSLFIHSVIAKVKRARIASQLKNDLESALTENRFQLATMNQHDIVCTCDTTNKITYVNDNFCDITGYGCNELLGRNYDDLHSGYHSDSFYRNLRITTSQGNVWHGTLCNKKKNGDDYWVETTIVPFLDNHGNVYKFVYAQTDITSLRENEGRLRLLLETVSEGIYGIDLKGMATFINPEACKILGYKPDEFINKQSHQLIHHSYPDGSPYFIEDCPIYTSLKKGKTNHIEDEVLWTKDGNKVPVEYTSTPLKNKGQTVGVVITFRDIRERKAVEEALLSAKEEALIASESKSEFLSSMSHELRTPLNAILGFTQLMKMSTTESLSQNQQENIDEIYMAGNHLLQLINDVLDLSKIEAGQINLSVESIALAAVVKDTVVLMLPLALNRGIDVSLIWYGKNITFEQLDDCQEQVQIDPVRLKQALLNLLSNAVKYNSEKGKIIIGVQHSIDQLTRISVTDTGNGLTDVEQSNLFEPFNRLSHNQNASIEGTGIGLVITKKIIELMGGRIGVDSEQERGCCFWIDIPSKRLNEYPKRKSAGNQYVGSHIAMGLKCDKSILYIEDNPTNLTLVSRVLKKVPSINLWNTPEARLGIELAAEYQPDLILLNINLPGMNGYEVLKALRQDSTTKNIPVIAIIEDDMPINKNEGNDEDFTDFVSKPLNISDFLIKVNGVLNA